METRRKTSIKYRILRLSLLSVGVAIICLCASMGISVNFVGKGVYREEVQSLATAYTANLETMASTLRMEAQSVAKNNTVLSFDFSDSSELSIDALKKELAELAANTYFTDLSIASSDGTVTTNGTNISDREYFNHAKQGETYIEGPILRRTDGSVIFMVGTPIDNGNVLYGSFTYDVLSTGLDATSLGEGGIIMLLNKKGEVMASSDESLIKEITNLTSGEYTDKAKGKIAAEVISGNAGSVELDDTYGRMLAYYQPVEGTDGWGICVMLNSAGVNAKITQSCLIGAGIGVFLMALGSAIAWIVSNKITKAILITSDRLKRLAEGDLYSTVEVLYTNDETEILSESLNTVCVELGKYVRNITETTKDMANGDFSYINRFNYIGDFYAISESFAEINRVLGEVISDMTAAAKDVTEGSAQIAEGTQVLADGTTRQATAVEELTTTIDEMVSQISSSADAATQAATLSETSAQKVEEQTAELKELLDAIQDIQAKSEKIANVIKVIEDIAFQTNILALNASIEAARAGDTGKGFAVVANEVGNLAAKSAEASKNTADLIKASIDAVKIGTEKANTVESKMQEVEEISKQVDTLIESIATVAKSEATAAEQVSVGIQQINDVVQQNSATAEQTAASCSEMSAQAHKLADKVATLKA